MAAFFPATQPLAAGMDPLNQPKNNPNHTYKGRHSTRIGILLTLPFVLYMATFLLIPLMSVAHMSTNTINGSYELEASFTIDNFLAAFNSSNLKILGRSALYATSTTIFCLLLGYPLAWFIARYGGKHKTVFLILLMLPFWTSYLIRIFAWMTILQSEGILNSMLLGLGIIATPLDLLNTPFSVILGLTYGYLPFATLPLYTNLEKLDFSLLEAASDLGSTPTSTFCHVIFPLSIPGIAASSLMTFVPAMGDFVTPEILGGVETMMVGNLIEQQYLSSFNWPLGAALSLILMVIMLCFIAIFLKTSGASELLA